MFLRFDLVSNFLGCLYPGSFALSPPSIMVDGFADQVHDYRLPSMVFQAGLGMRRPRLLWLFTTTVQTQLLFGGFSFTCDSVACARSLQYVSMFCALHV